jgi:arginine repressor
MPRKHDYDRNMKMRDRRRLIKKIINEKGFKGITELRRILLDEYGVSVVRQTLYTDMKYLGAVTEEDFDAISNKIIAGYNAHLQSLNAMVDNSKDEKTKIQAIRAYFQGTKELHELLNRITIRKQREPKKKDDKSYTIRFDDNIEVAEDA